MLAFAQPEANLILRVAKIVLRKRCLSLVLLEFVLVAFLAYLGGVCSGVFLKAWFSVFLAKLGLDAETDRARASARHIHEVRSAAGRQGNAIKAERASRKLAGRPTQ